MYSFQIDDLNDHSNFKMLLNSFFFRLLVIIYGIFEKCDCQGRYYCQSRDINKCNVIQT